MKVQPGISSAEPGGFPRGRGEPGLGYTAMSNLLARKTGTIEATGQNVSAVLYECFRTMQYMANGHKVDIDPSWDWDKIPDLEECEEFANTLNVVASYQGAYEKTTEVHQRGGEDEDIEVEYRDEDSFLIITFTGDWCRFEWETHQEGVITQYLPKVLHLCDAPKE